MVDSADPLNLSFEACETSDVPSGWLVGNPALRAACDSSIRQHGGASVKLTLTENAPFAVLARKLDATPYRGRRIQLSGWIRRENSTKGFVGLWLMARGAFNETVSLNNSNDVAVRTNGDWQQVTISIDVPDDASMIVLGPIVAGDGTAWVDHLQVEGLDPPPIVKVRVSGLVKNASEIPVEGASVAIVHGSEVVMTSVTGRDGKFLVTVPAGRYAISACHLSLVGAFLEPRDFLTDDAVNLQLPSSGGVRVEGTIGPEHGEDQTAFIQRLSTAEGDLFAVQLDTAGRFSVRLPTAEFYRVRVVSDTTLHFGLARTKGDNAVAKMEAATPATESVLSWAKNAGITIQNAERQWDEATARRVGAVIGHATLVGLGEATHGSSDIFLMKDGLIRLLVERLGFRLLMLEAVESACRPLNDYINGSGGDVFTAIAATHFWMFQTEEFASLMEWLRHWNENAAPAQRVTLIGIDMQYSGGAYDELASILDSVEPGSSAERLKQIRHLGSTDSDPDEYAKAEEGRAEVDNGLKALAEFLDSNEAPKKYGPSRLRKMRHLLNTLSQAHQMRVARAIGGTYASDTVRDKSMGENALYALSEAGPKARGVVWAHNAHVSLHEDDQTSMGEWLRRRIGKKYLSIGAIFRQGEFQAIDGRPDAKGGFLRAFRAPPAGSMDVSAIAPDVGPPVLVDFRGKVPADAHRWLQAVHSMWETGAIYVDRAGLMKSIHPGDRFDAAIFFSNTTRARPLQRSVPKPAP